MTEDIVRSLGYLSLGTRLKRLGERLQTDVQRLLDEQGLPLQSGHYPILAALAADGSMTIGELVLAVGISQPGVTRAVTVLKQRGVVTVKPKREDRRTKYVSLTPEGSFLVSLAQETLWPAIEAAVREVAAGRQADLLTQLDAIDDALITEPLDSRARKKL